MARLTWHGCGQTDFWGGNYTPMSAIELNGIVKRWGETVGVNDVSFEIEQGTFAVLLGPSGCGKSTTLRMIAGLEDVSEGTLRLAGADMTNVPPAERHISMVFQSYALFPHLSVEENILFGLKVRKIKARDRQKRLAKVADIVGLEQLLDRKPGQLSGGQRQRVALARAIIAENNICLMDEPLSNLDAKLRQVMRVEIRALQERLKMTVVYVTHDQAEAMSMADKVILMNAGRIEQEGTPDDLYNKPATTFTAAFIGTPPMNLLKTVSGSKGRMVVGDETIPVIENTPQDLLLGIRPEHIKIFDDAGHGGIRGTLFAADYQGADTIVTVQVGDQMVQVRSPGRVTISKGDDAWLTWKAANTHIFNLANGRRDETFKVMDVKRK